MRNPPLDYCVEYMYCSAMVSTIIMTGGGSGSQPQSMQSDTHNQNGVMIICSDAASRYVAQPIMRLSDLESNVTGALTVVRPSSGTQLNLIGIRTRGKLQISVKTMRVRVRTQWHHTLNRIRQCKVGPSIRPSNRTAHVSTWIRRKPRQSIGGWRRFSPPLLSRCYVSLQIIGIIDHDKATTFVKRFAWCCRYMSNRRECSTVRNTSLLR